MVERGGAKSGGGAKRSRPGALRAQATWRALIGGRGSGAGRCGRLRAAGGAAPGRAASLCRPRHGVRWPDGAHHRHERFLGTGRRRPAVAHTQGAQPRVSGRGAAAGWGPLPFPLRRSGAVCEGGPAAWP